MLNIQIVRLPSLTLVVSRMGDPMTVVPERVTPAGPSVKTEYIGGARPPMRVAIGAGCRIFPVGHVTPVFEYEDHESVC